MVEGFLHGLHRSPYVGFSLEFASHREYLRGDDLRHLNWKLFGRQDKLYVKQYDAETNLDLHLLVDWSGSMATATSGTSKQRYAACVAAAVAHLALMQHDAVGLTLFADTILEHVAPRAKSSQLNTLLNTFVQVAARPHGESACVLHNIVELMPRRGMVVLISDLLYEPEELFAALDHFRFHGHDVLIFQVLDPLERRMPVGGAVRFQDLETGGRTDDPGRRDPVGLSGGGRAMVGRPGPWLPHPRRGPDGLDHRRAAGWSCTASWPRGPGTTERWTRAMLGLNLIHFGFLAAAAAVSVPILIHLLLRPRARPQQIGSLRFLQQVLKESTAAARSGDGCCWPCGPWPCSCWPCSSLGRT